LKLKNIHIIGEDTLNNKLKDNIFFQTKKKSIKIKLHFIHYYLMLYKEYFCLIIQFLFKQSDDAMSKKNKEIDINLNFNYLFIIMSNINSFNFVNSFVCFL
jgi:hypothetical protein